MSAEALLPELYAVQRLAVLALDDGRLAREVLVRRAAVMDRHTELAPSGTDVASSLLVADGVVAAAQYARALLAHDREHGTTRGPIPAAAPCWEAHPLGYARQEHAAWVMEHDAP
ncbi:hypothetical protein [Streptomyces sp. NPDC017529]|uniref:hypothetical protein n=1 Tax=Streptomyces sp. NPDC017529 TaxID=3365000 RepID=UPI003789F1A2